MNNVYFESYRKDMLMDMVKECRVEHRYLYLYYLDDSVNLTSNNHKYKFIHMIDPATELEMEFDEPDHTYMGGIFTRSSNMNNCKLIMYFHHSESLFKLFTQEIELRKDALMNKPIHYYSYRRFILATEPHTVYEVSDKDYESGLCTPNRIFLNLNGINWVGEDMSSDTKKKKVKKDEIIKEEDRKFIPTDDIVKIIFNGNATIIYWKDKTKTVVKCADDEVYDPEKGLAMAFAKKALGNRFGWWGRFCNLLDFHPNINEVWTKAEKEKTIKSDDEEEYVQDGEPLVAPCKPKEKETRSCSTCVYGSNNRTINTRPKCSDCEKFSNYEEYKEPEIVVESDNLLEEKPKNSENLCKVIITYPEREKIAEVFENADFIDNNCLELKAKFVKNNHTIGTDILNAFPNAPLNNHDVMGTGNGWSFLVRNNPKGSTNDRLSYNYKADERYIRDDTNILYCQFKEELYGEYEGFFETRRLSKDVRFVVENPRVPIVYKLYLIPITKIEENKESVDIESFVDLIKDNDYLYLFAKKDTEDPNTIINAGIVLDTSRIIYEGFAPNGETNYSPDIDASKIMTHGLYSINIGKDLSELIDKDGKFRPCHIGLLSDSPKKDMVFDKFLFKVRAIANEIK